MFAFARIAAAFLVLSAVCLWAQVPTGEITGTVADSTGAVVAGATVTVTNPATNAQRVVTSNEAGIFDLPSLPPGTYNMRVEKAGFSTQVRNNIELQVSQVARMDVALQVGNVTETVEVTGGAPVLETESTSVGTVIENQRIVELPLNGRNYLQLAALTPGTTTNSQNSSVDNLRQGGTRSLFSLSVSGQRIFYNHYTLDGIENTDPNWNAYIFLPSLDALQEFKVETGIFPAEYGHNMNQINVTTKSGTNQIHGSLFEFLRNSALDAKNYFDPASKPIPPFRRNQFGATLGGPVVIPHFINGKDKLFFFVDYEGLRERKALTQGATVAPADWVSGNFSDVSTPIYDPTTRVLNAAGTAVVSSMPFQGNIIPANRINSISTAYMKQYSPTVNALPNALANDFINTEGRPTDNDQQNYRVDYSQSANSNWMFRYSHSGETQYNPINIPNQGSNVVDQAHQGVLGFTHLFGPTKVNDFRAGVSRLENSNIPLQAGVTNVVAQLGITGIDTSNSIYWGIPNTVLNGGFSGTGNTSDSPFINFDTMIQLNDNFSWTHGKHTFKFGGEITRTRFNQLGGVVTRGRFTETGQYTNSGLTGASTVPANNIADFMLGVFQTVESQTGEPVANYRDNYFGTYFEDSWKVTSKITINAGLRWEYQSPWVDTHDNIVNIDFNWSNAYQPIYVRAGTGDPYAGNPPYTLPSSISLVRDGRFGRGVTKPDYNNVGPRLGIAYALNSKTVIRVGGGMFYVHDIGNANFDVVRNAPFTIRRSETANSLIPNLNWSHLFTSAGIPSFILANQYGEPTPRVGQWSFGVQRQLTNDMSLEANYVGSSGMYLQRLITYNNAQPGAGNINARRPYPIFNGTVQVMNGSAHSTYHALQVRLQKRLSGGFTLLSSFSYAKSIDNGSGLRSQNGDGGVSNDYNLGIIRGLSAFDFRRNWTNSLLYQLPIGRGKALLGNASRALDAIVGGWQLGAILTLQDGFPLNASCGSSSVQNGGDGCYPDATGISPQLAQGSQDPSHWFNLGAFVNRVPGAGFRFGTAGRNTIIGPGIVDMDFSATKDFRVTERQRVQFRAEFFNIPNHPIFGQPGASVGSSTYGVITSTQIDSRQLQFGLKYSF